MAKPTWSNPLVNPAANPFWRGLSSQSFLVYFFCRTLPGRTLLVEPLSCMGSNALGQTLLSNHLVKPSNLLVKLAWSNPPAQTLLDQTLQASLGSNRLGQSLLVKPSKPNPPGQTLLLKPSGLGQGPNPPKFSGQTFLVQPSGQLSSHSFLARPFKPILSRLSFLSNSS